MIMDLRNQDLRNTDYTQTDTSGWIFAHANIELCKFHNCVGTNFVGACGAAIFTGADITGATFEKADESVLASLVGAIWNGQTITRVSGWLTQAGYWCFATDQFVQCGCLQKTFSEWDRICSTPDSIQELNQGITEPALLVDTEFAFK